MPRCDRRAGDDLRQRCAASKRFAFYGTDDTQLGEQVIADLSALMGGKGEVAILAGNPDANNLKARADAVRHALAAKPGIEVAAIVNHAETPLEAVNEVLKFDAAHPQLQGWAMVGGWPLFRSSQSPAMMAEIQKRGLKIVAVDALPEQLIYVERGLVPVLCAAALRLGRDAGEHDRRQAGCSRRPCRDIRIEDSSA